MIKLFTYPKLQQFIRPSLIIIALISFIQFTFTYGILVALGKHTLDFPSFYWASDALFNHNVSPYNIDYIQANTGLTVYPFIYTPPSILFFYPLSLFHYEYALIIHLIINHISVIIFISLLNNFFNYKNLSNQSLLIIIMIYNSYPIMQNIYFGQINTFIIIALLLFLILEDKKPILSSIMLSFAIITKIYPIIILILLLIHRQYKISIKIITSVSIISIISMLFIPKFVWNDWIFNIMPNGGYGKSPKGLPDPAYSYNKGFNGLFSRIFTNQQDSYQIMNYPLFAKLITYIVCLALCIITIFVVYKFVNIKDNKAVEKIFFITMPLIFMIAPVSWNLHLITLYPTIIYLFRIYYNKFTNKINSKLILIFLITLFFSMQSNSDISLFFVFILWIMMLEVIAKQQYLFRINLGIHQSTQIGQLKNL